VPPRLSVVIVNWNTAALTLDCLRSLLQPALAIEFDVTVVDNGSTDDSVVRISSAFPELRVIRNAGNRGFAAANNQGIAASAGRYVLLLNSDTRIPRDALERLVSFMDAQAGVAACAPRLLRSDGSVQPYAFGGDPTPLYLTKRRLYALFGRALHDWGEGHTLEVDWVSGACLMARREAIERVGGLDESMFMYFEDNDWCLRFRRAGWKVVYFPEASIVHLGGGSAAASADASRAYRQSLRRFYRKHYGPLARLWLAGAMALGARSPDH
jgi:N-acetylglucosaminyl-diphospho-decaprenol L-rhamnosyltransferase